jgi:hypothetical protein
MFLLAPALVCGAARAGEIAPDEDGDRFRSYVLTKQLRGDFFGDGRETLIELIDVDDMCWPNYFWRVTPPGAREPKYYQLSLYTYISGLEPYLNINDIDGDGIPEIFARYHAGGTGGLEFALYSFKGGKPMELSDTMNDNNTEYPDIGFELMDGFKIKASYAGKETVYEVSDSSPAGYFFDTDGTVTETAIPDRHLTWKFFDIDLVDVDGDGISEIKGSLEIGGASNASHFGDVDVVFVWKDGKLRARDVEIRFH